MHENFESLGLKLTLNPSFKHSKEGKQLRKELEEFNKEQSMSEEEQEEESSHSSESEDEDEEEKKP